MGLLGLLVGLVFGVYSGLGAADFTAPEGARSDGAVKLNIRLEGSLQNPAFSPDGRQIVFTRFRNGYNKGPADLFVFSFENGRVRSLVADGNTNVSLPGASWNRTRKEIVFSSDRGKHDELFVISEIGRSGDERQLTQRRFMQSYGPSYSPFGRWVVFESHGIDEQSGSIAKAWYDGGREFQILTSPNDIVKHPNWSPLGDKILYQKLDGGIWRVWIMAVDGSEQMPVTSEIWNSTQPTFSADGRNIVFSSVRESHDLANIFSVSINGGNVSALTQFRGYDGAPSVSSDGKWVLFESSELSPELSEGTSLWIRDLSVRLTQ